MSRLLVTLFSILLFTIISVSAQSEYYSSYSPYETEDSLPLPAVNLNELPSLPEAAFVQEEEEAYEEDNEDYPADDSSLVEMEQEGPFLDALKAGVVNIGDKALNGGQTLLNKGKAFLDLLRAKKTAAAAEKAKVEKVKNYKAKKAAKSAKKTTDRAAKKQRRAEGKVQKAKRDQIWEDGDKNEVTPYGRKGHKGPFHSTEYRERKQRRKQDRLAAAMTAVKEEIMVRAKELRAEKQWTKEVESLMKDYSKKVKKVNQNIDTLKAQTKDLLKKKKQIQNAQIQEKLVEKLKVAKVDLNKLQKQMDHIKNKEEEFSSTEAALKKTMDSLKGHLTKLKGDKKDE